MRRFGFGRGRIKEAAVAIWPKALTDSLTPLGRWSTAPPSSTSAQSRRWPLERSPFLAPCWPLAPLGFPGGAHGGCVSQVNRKLRHLRPTTLMQTSANRVAVVVSAELAQIASRVVVGKTRGFIKGRALSDEILKFNGCAIPKMVLAPSMRCDAPAFGAERSAGVAPRARRARRHVRVLANRRLCSRRLRIRLAGVDLVLLYCQNAHRYTSEHALAIGRRVSIVGRSTRHRVRCVCGGRWRMGACIMGYRLGGQWGRWRPMARLKRLLSTPEVGS